MAQTSTIEWTEATWNPITGCSVVSPGCTNCYAMRLAGTRLRHHPSRAALTVESKAGPVWNGQVRLNAEWLDQPLRWRRPRKIFVCAHGDLFHPGVSILWLDRIFARMALADWHILQVLTKRPGRARDYLSDPMTPARIAIAIARVTVKGSLAEIMRGREIVRRMETAEGWPFPHVWLGVSVEDQQRANERRDDLAALAASGWTTFVSYEPALGPVDWRGWEFLKWLISGGESGRNARPSHPDWHRAALNFCSANGVAFFHKQNGEWRAVSEGEGDWFEDLYRPKVVARHGESQDALNDIYGRRCTVPQIVMARDGVVFSDIAAKGAFQQGSGSMLMFRVGKKAAGRLLDGVAHDGMLKAFA